MRDLHALIDNGSLKIEAHQRMDLTASELQQLYDEFQSDKIQQSEGNAIFNLIDKAYHIGIAIGSRIG